MIADAVLARASEKIIRYINEQVTLANPSKKETVLELFNNMRNLFPQWVIATCPMLHPQIQYITSNAPLIFGYDEAYLMRNSRLENFLRHIHPSDQDDLYECMGKMQAFAENISPDEHQYYRFVFYYRFRKADGQYVFLHDERAILRLQGENLYFAMYRDIGNERSFSGVKLEIFRQGALMEKIEEHKPSSVRQRLSKRENELVTLIRQGLSIKEIAGCLKISPNTARNIKSKLFEKYNVSNSIELLNMIS